MSASDHRPVQPSPALSAVLPAAEMSACSLTHLLTRHFSSGTIVQELAPIWRSLPWLRSQRYWAQADVEVFTSGEVPYVVTNDGEQSRKAVDLYLASLRAADAHGERERMSYVLEVGTGSGLFAKLFLDQLRDRSRAQGLDAYDRTTYLVGDHSPGLLHDTRASGVFAEHEARVERVALPGNGLRAALGQVAGHALASVRAVHANYVLDSLPFTILSARGNELFELQVRTRLREGVVHPEGGSPPNDDLEAMCTWLDQIRDGGQTLGHDLLEYEGEYVRVDRGSLPEQAALPAFEEMLPSGDSRQAVHSFGALEYLREIVGILRPDGHFVALDYSYPGASSEPIEFQCFGTSIAAGVNFAQLVEAGRALPGVVVVPETDPVNLQGRLFAGPRASSQVLDLFRSLYDKASWDAIDAPFREAIELQQGGQYEAARWKFDAAHKLQPYNWNLMESMVAFLTYTVGEHAAGLEIAKRALQLNHLSPRLWNLLGDCYYGLDDLPSAERAYLQAARVNPSDARSRTNLSYVHLRQGAASTALRVIGEALALDRAGDYRNELLAKQTEALQILAARQTQGAVGNLNRLRGHHALPGRQSTDG